MARIQSYHLGCLQFLTHFKSSTVIFTRTFCRVVFGGSYVDMKISLITFLLINVKNFNNKCVFCQLSQMEWLVNKKSGGWGMKPEMLWLQTKFPDFLHICPIKTMSFWLVHMTVRTICISSFNLKSSITFAITYKMQYLISFRGLWKNGFTHSIILIVRLPTKLFPSRIDIKYFSSTS